MLDVISQGRLEVAFPLGTGMEYWANPINPSTARARYRESIDIIFQAWTQDGPTTYYGDFFTYRYLNPWPRPVQKPHPPCYIVGTGSPETIDLAASSALATPRCLSPSRARVNLTRTCAGSRPNTAIRSGPSSFPSKSSPTLQRPRKRPRGSGRAHPLFLRGCASHHADIPGAARISLRRRTQEARGAGGQAARRVQLRQHQRVVLRRRRHRRSGCRATRRMGRADGDQPLQHSWRHRQHAALEGGQEPEFFGQDVIPRCGRAPPRTPRRRRIAEGNIDGPRQPSPAVQARNPYDQRREDHRAHRRQRPAAGIPAWRRYLARTQFRAAMGGKIPRHRSVPSRTSAKPATIRR